MVKNFKVLWVEVYMFFENDFKIIFIGCFCIGIFFCNFNIVKYVVMWVDFMIKDLVIFWWSDFLFRFLVECL